MSNDGCKQRDVRRVIDVYPNGWYAGGHVSCQAIAPAGVATAAVNVVQTCSTISSVNSAYIGSESSRLICSCATGKSFGV